MSLQRAIRTLGGVSAPVVLLLGLSGCTSTQNVTPPPAAGGSSTSASFSSSAVCAQNPFLQKYQCSFPQISQAARAGDPDAQYALGYLYYYGIGTTQDRQTGLVWIRRAAAQGQSVAQQALQALSSTPPVSKPTTNANPASSVSPATPTNVGASSGSTANNAAQTSAQPEKPITDYLPNYGEKRINTTSPPSVNLSAPPATQNQ